MWCESGGRPDAVGGNNYGLFQLSDIHARAIPDFWEHWMIPEFNVAWAFGFYSDGGWSPWGCRYS
jgi:hypothetical protein